LIDLKAIVVSLKMNRFTYDLLRRNKRWQHRIVSHSKSSDRNSERDWEPDSYITAEFLTNLRKIQNNLCFYCKYPLITFNRKQHNGLTVERLNNEIAHTKDNSKICCHACNCRKLTPARLQEAKIVSYLERRMKHGQARIAILAYFTPNHSRCARFV
jgi:hypothetical protein